MNKKAILLSAMLLLPTPVFAKEITWGFPVGGNHTTFADYMKTSHSLRKMTNLSESHRDASAGGGYFLFSGVFNAEMHEYTTYDVVFAWDYRGTFVISKVPIERIRVMLVKEKVEPKVSVVIADEAQEHWFDDNSKIFMENCIKYVLVIANEEDWNYNVEMPELPKGEK